MSGAVKYVNDSVRQIFSLLTLVAFGNNVRVSKSIQLVLLIVLQTNRSVISYIWLKMFEIIEYQKIAGFKNSIVFS